MLMRFDPFAELDRLSRDRIGGRPAVMPMDAYRSGEQFVIRFDLPGVDASSIDLTLEKNVLTVRAERGWKPADGEEVVVSERPQGIFSRQLFLGETLDSERIDAHYDQGVLTLTVPVAERARPRRVEVSTGVASENGSGGAIDAGSHESESRAVGSPTAA